MIVLDTTVLVYATGSEHRLRGPCRRLITAAEDGGLAATTTVEAIQEFTHVRARRGRVDAAEIARAYADLLAPLLVVDTDDLRDGLRLFQDHTALGSFDAVLAAATRTAGASALVSADAGFAAVSGLTHVVPDESGVESLLGPETQR